MTPIRTGCDPSGRPSHPRSPTSPSTSATATASPSPRPSKDRIFYLPARPRRTNSSKTHSSTKWPNDSQTDSSGSGTETKQGRPSPHPHPRKRAVRRASEKALTLHTPRMSTSDPLLTMSPPSSGRPLSRRSPSPSSSSSSPSSPTSRMPPPVSAGIGRKVAASLDLFRESIPTPSSEDVAPFERPRSSASRRKTVTAHAMEDMAEAQFEFVKRSDWPDREAAAIRRERSMTGLERVRTHESTGSTTSVREQDARRSQKRKMSFRDTVLNDLVQWRNAVAEDTERGRLRDRGVWLEDTPQETLGSPGTGLSVSSNLTPHEHTSPADALEALSPPTPRSRSPGELPALSAVPTPFSHQPPPPVRVSSLDAVRSPTPVQDHIPAPAPTFSAYPSIVTSDLTSPSPWSTDDESAWDSASVTTTSTTEASSPFPMSPSRTSPAPQPLVRHPSDEDEEQQQRALLVPYDELELDPRQAASEDRSQEEFDFGAFHESLPHIPLRPFRNQVGGHSAIYKFTKRAVCKASVLFLFSRIMNRGLNGSFRSVAPSLSREFVLRSR